MTPTLAVKLATLAYQPWLVIEAKLPELRIGDFQYYDFGGTQCFVGTHAETETAAVVFSGTKDLNDWFFNVRFRKVDFQSGPGRVHRGFLKGIEHVWGNVEYYLKKRDLAKVALIGHSLGGAYANIGAALLAYRHWPIVGVWTFGCPRVGNREFAKFIEKHCAVHRFVNCADIVPRWPKLFYWHAGKPTYFDFNGRQYFNPPKLYAMFDRCRAYWKHGAAQIDAGRLHHGVRRYQERVEAAA